MELQPIRDEEEITRLLSELGKQVDAGPQPSNFLAPKGYKFEVRPERNENDHRYFVLLADGAGAKQLAFSGWTPSGNGPTLLAQNPNDGQRYVLHTGRPLKDGIPKYRTSRKEVIDGRTYFLVGKLEWPSLFTDAVDFYESAFFEGQGDKVDRRERGPEEPHIRSQHWVVPRHFEIWDRAETWLKENGYTTIKGSSKADFCAVKAGKKAVVEVKPDRSPQSMYTAIGQLLSYAYQETANGMILILPEGDDREQIDILNEVTPQILVVPLRQSSRDEMKA